MKPYWHCGIKYVKGLPIEKGTYLPEGHPFLMGSSVIFSSGFKSAAESHSLARRQSIRPEDEELTALQQREAEALYHEFVRLHPGLIDPQVIDCDEKAEFLMKHGSDAIALLGSFLPGEKEDYGYYSPTAERVTISSVYCEECYSRWKTITLNNNVEARILLDEYRGCSSCGYVSW